jgi:TonB family protein
MSQQNGIEIETLPIREIAKGWEGQLINGEFYLRQYLGGSDHSAVFLTAYDEQEPQPAAIKFISADSKGAEIQFSRWELATKLSHPNLLRIFQIGRCELRGVNLLYAVMEYAEEDLSQILPQRALTPDETRGMLAATLDALAYIHDKQSVHGHICSSNIMASGDQLKLSIDRLCPIGELPAMPNLQPFAEARTELSPANDVWALGMLLVEVCTQNPPTWDSAGSAEPVVPRTLPAPFFDIARNCLRKDPLRRWTISDIGLGLQALPKPESHETQEQKVLTQQTSEQETKSVSLRKLISTSAIALILVLLIAVPKLFKRELKSQPSISSSKVAFLPETTTHDQIAAIPATNSIDAAKTNSAGADPSFLSRQPALVAELPTPHTANPDVVNQVLPDVPQNARDTIRGTVRINVKVTVDSSGGVQEIALDEPGPSTYFANLAVRAARQWKFKPLAVNREDAPREWILWFAFSADDTKAVAVRSGYPPHAPSND